MKAGLTEDENGEESEDMTTIEKIQDTSKHGNSMDLISLIGQGDNTTNDNGKEPLTKRPRPEGATTRKKTFKWVEGLTNGRKKKKPQKKANDKYDDFDDMAWICAECKEAECQMQPSADEFLLCDGDCHRVFHYPCAGLSELPTGEAEWLCKDCLNGRHQCAFCHQYGKDNVDVFQCKKSKCGLFFHESCLAMHNVEVTMVQKTIITTSTTTTTTTATDNGAANAEGTDTTTVVSSSEQGMDRGNDGREVKADEDDKATAEASTDSTGLTSEIITVPSFVCPAHKCWTCTQIDDQKKELRQQQQQEDDDDQASSIKAGNNRKRKRPTRKKKNQSIFQCKTESRLFRCIVCPIAYHATCIPPSSKFHELAVLCHEHSSTHKLPDLDLATSFQGSVEDKIDRKILKLSGNNRNKQRLKGLRANSSNPFFPGLRGDRLIRQEKFVLEYISKQQELEEEKREANDDDNDSNVMRKNSPALSLTPRGFGGGGFANDFSFCLPCDVKNEVHSKPPNYTHVHALRYNPKNRPKRILTKGEKCNCEKVCGPDCFNRIIQMECYGNNGTGSGSCSGSSNSDGYGSNCPVGGDCGNRALGKRQYVKCKPQREGGKGWGLITMEDVAEGQLVMEYVGEVIDEMTKEKRLTEWNTEHPNDPNFYVMAMTGGWYIDAREYANMSRFINHSCNPNCHVKTVNVKGYMRCGIYSKCDIKAGEFLSYDYQFQTQQSDRFLCRCGSDNCRGTMGVLTPSDANGNDNDDDDDDKKPSSKKSWKDAKARYDADKKFLMGLYGKDVTSQVNAHIPAAEQPNEYVFAGPPEKHRDSVIRNRIFLWRNTSIGSDFVTRNARRLEKQQNGRQQEQKEEQQDDDDDDDDDNYSSTTSDKKKSTSTSNCHSTTSTTTTTADRKNNVPREKEEENDNNNNKLDILSLIARLNK